MKITAFKNPHSVAFSFFTEIATTITIFKPKSEFTGSPVVKTLSFHCLAERVQFPVGELISLMPLGVAPKLKMSTNQNQHLFPNVFSLPLKTL